MPERRSKSATRRNLAHAAWLLENKEARESLGASARQVLEQNSGATARTLEGLRKYLERERGRPPATFPRGVVNPLYCPLAVFRFGVALRHAGYNRGWFQTRRLARPVVSVGNLPWVGRERRRWLPEHRQAILLRTGWKPSILTRGYGRSSKAD